MPRLLLHRRPAPNAVTPTPEELALVDGYLDRMEASADLYLPRTAHLSTCLEYDGVYTCARAADILQARRPSASAVATKLFEHAEELAEVWWGYDKDHGPLEDPGFSGPAGYYCYNLGCRYLALHPARDPAKTTQYELIAANIIRAQSLNLWVGYYDCHFADNTYPSATTKHDPAGTNSLTRTWSLMLLSHLVMDDIFGTYEQREICPAYDYQWAHDNIFWRILDRWFFQATVGACEQWEAITAEVAAAGGDFTQVQNVWRISPYWEWLPWAWCHFSRFAACYHLDPLDDSFNALFETWIPRFCDWAIDWCQSPTNQGRPALWYEIRDGGAVPNGSHVLALFHMPMFALAYRWTGQRKYYDFAIQLLRTGVEQGGWQWGKFWNQQMIWSWWGLIWLGLVDDAFNVEWR